MSERYTMPCGSDDELLATIDRADAEIERWSNIKKVAIGRLARLYGKHQEILFDDDEIPPHSVEVESNNPHI